MKSLHRILKIRMSIFNHFAHTMRIVRPFVWNDTYLKVHPNGAAVFADQKKLAFLLPLIIGAHALLPPTPLFWTNDDQTIPLLRTTLWLHERTIQWLAETGEAYPPELRNEIQPRLDKLKPSQPAKKLQPPPPPKPSRWQVRPQEKQIMQAPQEPAPQDLKGAQTSPQQVADHERQYMELQATFARMRQRTIAESRPTNSTQSQASASLSASRPPATGAPNTTLPPQIGTNAATEASVQQDSHRPPKISAQSLADQRLEPPSPPSTHEPKTDTPGTGELSTHSPHPSVQTGTVDAPNHNNHTPWPQTCQTAHVLCGQQASLQLPTGQILPLLEALQKRLGIDPSNAELAINEVLASHADPQYNEWKIIIMDNTAWQLNPADTGSLDVQCTGLGGGES